MRTPDYRDENPEEPYEYDGGYRQPAPPTREWVPSRPPPGRPVVTYTLLAISIIVYILQEASGFMTGQDLPALFGMKVNQWIIEGEYWRLITPMFLHGSIMHIAFNMYALYIFGPGLERHFGRGRFIVLYFLAGFAGNIFSFIFSPNPSLGSSTAIFGLIGAQAVFLYRNKDMFSGMAQRALSQIVTIAVINLVIGLSPGIDNWGHIGGLIGGSIFTFLAGPVLELKGFSPYQSISDRRETRQIVMASLGLGAVLVLLAAAAIYYRGGDLLI
jgi:rhomboid protease GluP